MYFALRGVLPCLIKAQLCEKQEGCRDDVVKMIDEFENFLELVKLHGKELQETRESRDAMEHILRVTTEASVFIQDNTSPSILSVTTHRKP